MSRVLYLSSEKSKGAVISGRPVMRKPQTFGWNDNYVQARGYDSPGPIYNIDESRKSSRANRIMQRSSSSPAILRAVGQRRSFSPKHKFASSQRCGSSGGSPEAHGGALNLSMTSYEEGETGQQQQTHPHSSSSSDDVVSSNTPARATSASTLLPVAVSSSPSSFVSSPSISPASRATTAASNEYDNEEFSP